MQKLFLWLNWHAGDLVLCRPLVRRILSLHDVQIAWGCWKNQAYIIEDLPVRVIADPRDDPREGARPSLMHLCPPGHAPIYLWIGCYPDTLFHHWEIMVELYNRQIQSHGLPKLMISPRFVPMVDFPPVDVSVADNAVFVENGATRSGHSDFEFDMGFLGAAFPGLVFYCTAKPAEQASNLVDCSALNLRELSSVSARCTAIAGKGSGPFCSTLIETNRYKPRAIMRYHPFNAGQTLWDYPGNPMQYLETQEELVRFLQTVEQRNRAALRPGSAPIAPASQRLPEDSGAAAVDHLLQQFVRNQNDPEYVNAVAAARDRITQFWRELPPGELEYAYRGSWGKAHRRLVGIGIAVPALPAPSSPTTFADLAAAQRQEDNAVLTTTLLAFMLSLPREKLPEDLDMQRIAYWLHRDVEAFRKQDWAFLTRPPVGPNYGRGMIPPAVKK